MEKRINTTEVSALAAYVPARVKGLFTFELVNQVEENTIKTVTKGIAAHATTLKSAIKEAGQMVANCVKAYESCFVMVFVYMNGRFIGTMTTGENRVIRVDFSGWAIMNSTAEEETTTEETTETETTTNTETTMSATDTTNNVLATLKSELQEYHDNASKGGENRRRNMALLAWDIRRMERKLNTVNA